MRMESTSIPGILANQRRKMGAVSVKPCIPTCAMRPVPLSWLNSAWMPRTTSG